MYKQIHAGRFAAPLILFISTYACWGQGFSNDDHGTRAAGQANAFTARASDASAVWYNPAGLTGLAGTQLYAGGSGMSHPLEYYSEFYDDTYSSEKGAVLSPHFYLTRQLSGTFWAGVGFGMPVHYRLDWGDDPAQHAVRNCDPFRISTHTISPCIAFTLNAKTSVGLGLHYMMSHITLVKWDRIEIENLAMQELGIAVTDYFLQSEYAVSGSGLAWFGGIRTRLSENVLFGFTCQGGHHDPMSGTLDYRHKQTVYTDLDPLVEDAFPDGDVTFQGRTTVHQYTAGLAVSVSGKFECELDYNYKMWSRQDRWEYTLSEPVLQEDLSYSGEGEVPWNWVNSGSIRLGGEYHVSPALDARAGVSFTGTPVPGDWLMTPVPDSEHWGIHLGAGYTFSSWTVDIGYTHQFYEKRVNLAWYGMRLAESRSSTLNVSLGRRF